MFSLVSTFLKKRFLSPCTHTSTFISDTRQRSRYVRRWVYPGMPAKSRSISSPFEREQGFITTDSIEDCLRDARQCMQKVCEVAGSLGRDEDDVECGVLSRDAVSRNLFETLLPKMRSLLAQGGTGGGFCNAWMSALSVLLTSKDRESYGMAFAAS